MDTTGINVIFGTLFIIGLLTFLFLIVWFDSCDKDDRLRVKNMIRKFVNHYKKKIDKAKKTK